MSFVLKVRFVLKITKILQWDLIWGTSNCMSICICLPLETEINRHIKKWQGKADSQTTTGQEGFGGVGVLFSCQLEWVVSKEWARGASLVFEKGKGQSAGEGGFF